MIPHFPKLASQTNLGFPSFVDISIGFIAAKLSPEISFQTHLKGLQCWSKLVLGWLWILRISGWLWLVQLMIEIFVCGVNVAASIKECFEPYIFRFVFFINWNIYHAIDQREIGFQQNQESHNCLWLNEKETKTYKKNPYMIYLLLGLFRSVRRNPKA